MGGDAIINLILPTIGILRTLRGEGVIKDCAAQGINDQDLLSNCVFFTPLLTLFYPRRKGGGGGVFQ